ncbi:MAG: hypothetical protein K9G58_01165 [Bacteroidales bacterium]|nr:hypothetical protein [Bacteroidales bacterium]MCF8387441.1 hypothetical protein [Bacteroidales bacterium]MCF8396745.1 hypothetical protein [Bacteroidales bacterium]
MPNRSLFSEKNILLFVSLFAIQLTFAQKTFREAYVQLTENDTLFGEIDNKSYYQNSHYCDFRIGEGDSVERYFPAEIYAYHFVDGKFYISKEVLVNGKEEKLFLEFLLDGELDIYFYQDKGRQGHYFVGRDSLPLKELRYVKDIIDQDGKMMQVVRKPYTGILSYYTSDAPQLEDQIQNINQPTHKKMIRFGESYHNMVCKDEECIIYEKRMPWAIIVEASVQNTHYRKKLIGDENIWPFVGVNAYFMNPRFSEKGFFGIGVLKMLDPPESMDFISSFKIPISYSYIHPKNGFSPTIRGSFNIFPNFDYPTTISFTPGIKYEMGNFYLRAFADMEIVFFGEKRLYYLSTSYGLGLNYKISSR